MNTTATTLTHAERIEAIKQIVCDHYSITVKELMGDGRQAHVARPRQVAMSIARELLGLSTPRLAELFNRTDHGTILHACKGIHHARTHQRLLWDEHEMLKAACCTALGIPPAVKKWRAA